MIAERERPTSNEVKEEQLFEWLQEKVEKVIEGGSRECTLLSYEFKEGKEILLFPPLYLPDGRGPFSETARTEASNRILNRIFGAETTEEREEWVGIITEEIRTEPPTRKKQRAVDDILEWEFNTFCEGDICLIVQVYRDPKKVLGVAWHLKNRQPKSRIQKWQEGVRRLIFKEQFVQV